MTNPDYTHICLVADRSGSMYNIVEDANGGIAQFMQDQANEPGTCLVDVIIFDSVIDVLYDNVAPLEVSDHVIEPRANTALNDAIGFGITRLGNKFRLMPEENRPGTVIFVVVTDGMENASVEYTHAQVRRLVEQQTEQYGWTFLYLAANVDAFATGKTYGFQPGTTMAFAGSGQGVADAYAGISKSASRTRSGLDADFTEEERKAAEQS